MPVDAANSATVCDRIDRLIEEFGSGPLRQQPLVDLVTCRAEDAERIIEVITLCPSLSARVLSVINSAALGMPRRIYSVDRAVNLLGSARSRFLAMAHGLRMVTEKVALNADQVKRLWYNSVLKGCCARTLCSEIDPPRFHDAFALALIQDIALPMLLADDPKFYRKLIEQNPSPSQWCQAEREHFGIDHAQAGAKILDRWGSSDHLVSHVATHHDNPLEQEDPTPPSPLQLAVFMASLLPHDNEVLSPQAMNWFGAIHAKFLASRNGTPDSFLEEVAGQARLIEGRESKNVSLDQGRLQRAMVESVCSDAPGLVTNIYRLEISLLSQQRDIASLQSEAMTDPLTGLLNRRGFETLAEQRMEWNRNQEKGLCIMMGDLDGLKVVNDTLGHEAGDEALAALANLMRSSVRGDDLIGRMGGDEFAMLIDQVDAATAQRLTQKISRNINGREVLVRHGQPVALSISLGAFFISQPDEVFSVNDLLARADAAMYKRKRNGKQGLYFINAVTGEETDCPAIAQAG